LDSADEAVISKSFARQYFPGEDPLGRHLRVRGQNAVIVGIVGDTRYSIGETPRPVQYFPVDAGVENVGTLVIRSRKTRSSSLFRYSASSRKWTVICTSPTCLP
jgi:hypothetical protein